MPQNAPFSTAPVAAYVSLNDYPGNFGHALYDFLFPVFNILQLMNLYDPDFQLLLAEHQASFHQHATPRQVHSVYLAMYIQYIGCTGQAPLCSPFLSFLKNVSLFTCLDVPCCLCLPTFCQLSMNLCAWPNPCPSLFWSTLAPPLYGCIHLCPKP